MPNKINIDLNKIELVEYVGVNPFKEYDVLNYIWDKKLTEVAEEGVLESIEIKNEYEIGKIYLIKHNDDVVGITGFYPYHDFELNNKFDFNKKLDVGLRWHGVINECRNQGVSRHVLTTLANEILHRYPNASNLIELVPLYKDNGAMLAITECGVDILKYFKKLGFVGVSGVEKYSWHPDYWVKFKIDINKLASYSLNKPNKGYGVRL